MENSRKNNFKYLLLLVSFCLFLISILIDGKSDQYFLLPIILGAIFLFFLIDWLHRLPFFKTNGFYLFCVSLMFISYLFVDNALFDHLIFMFFVFSILFDSLYKISKLIQAKILKKGDYSYKNIIYFAYTLMLFFVLIQIQAKDSHQLENNVISIYRAIDGACEGTRCYTQNITQGVTTFALHAEIVNGCMEATSYFAIPSIRPVKECESNSSIQK